MEKSKIYRNITNIAGSTLVSRVLGYLRDMVVASYFGASAVADTFYVAYRIPNLLRRLLGEGALVASFVPVYTDYIERKTPEEQKKFLDTVITVLTLILIVLTILGIIFAPIIVNLIAPGFAKDPEKMRLAIFLTRVMFPFLISIGVAAFFMGVLYVHHIFIYSAFSSCFLSISEVLFMFAICPFLNNPILGLAIGVVVGGFAQAYYQIIPLMKKKISFSFSFDLKNEGLRKVAWLMLPATIGVSFDQISSFVDMIFASWLRVGSVSALYYSNRLMQLPLALFGVAVSTICLPILSKSATYENFDKLKEQLRDNFSLMSYFIIPSSIGLIVLAHPIVKLLFERGKFDTIATDMTSITLQYYSIGIIAYSGVKIISTAYYSMKDTKTPVKIAAFCVLINVLCNFILMKLLGVGGLALSTSISAILNVTLLICFLNKKIGDIGFKNISWNFMKILAVGVVMGVFCFYLSAVFAKNRVLTVCVPLVVGTMLYVALSYFLHVKEIRYVMEAIVRKFNK